MTRGEPSGPAPGQALVALAATLCSLAFLVAFAGLIVWASLDDMRALRPLLWPWMALGTAGFVLLLADKWLTRHKQRQSELLRLQQWKSSPQGQAHAAALRLSTERLRALNAGLPAPEQTSGG
jgi:hypothetical protein